MPTNLLRAPRVLDPALSTINISTINRIRDYELTKEAARAKHHGARAKPGNQLVT